MRTTISTVMVLLALFGLAQRADAATLQVTLNLMGQREIEIPIAQFPTEFRALDSTWGSVTVNGAVVGYYILSRSDMRHAGSQAPSVYPDPWYTLVIRTVGTPSDLLIMQGSRRTLAEGGAAFGGVTVATAGVAFLRGAQFQLENSVLTLTY